VGSLSTYGPKDGNLHLQIVGVWEPEKLSQQVAALEKVRSEKSGEYSSLEIEDGYFSVRGEVVYQSASDGHFIVKIKQSPVKRLISLSISS
jgi:hypothetical protein